MSLIKGLHHVSMKTSSPEEYKKAVEFYSEVLQLEVVRMWSDGIMFDTGSGIIELFTNGDGSLPKGNIRHFALLTDNVDKCVDAVKKAGYEVFIEPNDMVINSVPAFPIRMAFCYGPLGEEIEFFQEK